MARGRVEGIVIPGGPVPWDHVHDTALLNGVDAGLSIAQIAMVIKRTLGACEKRLCRLRSDRLKLTNPNLLPEERAVLVKRSSIERARKARGRHAVDAGCPWPKVYTDHETALGTRRYDDMPGAKNVGRFVMISPRFAARYQGSGCGNAAMMCLIA